MKQGTFKELFREKKYYDITIHVDGSAIQSHKAVLMESSKQLQAIIEKEDEITIQDIDPQSFEKVLKFLYLGKLNSAEWDEIPIDCVYKIFVVSTKLELYYLMQHLIAYYIIPKMDRSNCFTWLSLIQVPLKNPIFKHMLRYLSQYVQNYFSYHSQQIVTKL